MNKTKAILGIGIVLAVLAVLTAPAAAYNVMYFVPQDSSSAAIGEEVTVWLMLNTSHSDVGGFGANIAFNTNVVNITNVEEGTTPDWDQWEWHHWGDWVYISGLEFGGTGPGVLQLGKMTLKGINPGTSTLNFQKLFAPEDGTGVTDTYYEWYTDFTVINGTFACGITPETFSKDLVEGGNLVSLPLTPLVDNSTSAVLSSMSGKYDAVYSYDAVTKDFVDVSGGTMDPGTGYFVHVTTAGTWTYNGVAETSMNVPLEQGLNMVGWHNCTKTIGHSTGDALYSIKDNYYYVARWNAAAQEFETYNPVAPNGFNDFADMERGDGYFISAKAESTLSESC